MNYRINHLTTPKNKYENTTLIDLHVHTSHSICSSLNVEDTLAEISGKVHGIVVTDHDHVLSLPDSIINTYYQKFQVNVFTPAVEISALEGHLLAYGLSQAPPINIDVETAIQMIHQENGIAIAAHPFAVLGLGNLVYSLDLDAIEINGNRTKTVNEEARVAAESLGLPLVGGSDSHQKYQIGTCVTAFEGEIVSMANLISAVKKGKCKPLFIKH
ncbi:MAG: PHP domain-containing protein [Asgard group archaeon]|nr:PHP domain-containing protein [Asgard group archaeon]